MGIKDFFKKVGRGIKNTAGKIWGGIKKGVGFVGRVAKPVLGVLSALPGKLGMIGKVGTVVTGAAKDVIDRIPNENAKEKLNRVIDKGGGVIADVQQRAQGIADKVKPYADAGLSIINKPPKLNM